MKWRGWSCSLLFVFSLFCVGGVIINQKNNASAVSDITYTSTFNGSSFSSIGVMCSNADNNPAPCSDYNYLIIEKSFDFYTLCNSTGLNLITFNYSGQQITGYSDFVIFHLDSGVSRVGFFGVTSSCSGLTTSDYVKYTLTESYQSGAPSGSLSITENGTYDVTNYAEAVVDVPVPEPEVIPGDYHDDLVSINNAILIVPAVALVVYFFYAIYKMLLGGKTL